MASEKRRDRREYRRKYYLANREKELNRAKKWLKNNPKSRSESNRRYYRANWKKMREQHREYKRNRRRTDPLYRLKDNLRRRIIHAVTRIQMRKNRRTMDILGCEMDFLKRHIEAQFSPGMTWENYGRWHIDHIVPLATAKSKEAAEKLCHYTNLAPLWAEDNFAKGAKLKWPSRRLRACVTSRAAKAAPTRGSAARARPVLG